MTKIFALMMGISMMGSAQVCHAGDPSAVFLRKLFNLSQKDIQRLEDDLSREEFEILITRLRLAKARLEVLDAFQQDGVTIRPSGQKIKELSDYQDNVIKYVENRFKDHEKLFQEIRAKNDELRGKSQGK